MVRALPLLGLLETLQVEALEGSCLFELASFRHHPCLRLESSRERARIEVFPAAKYSQYMMLGRVQGARQVVSMCTEILKFFAGSTS